MRTNLGRVSALPRGSWAEETTYNKGDVVRNVKSVYIALQESKNVEPGVSFLWSQFWKLIATDGDQTDVALLSESLNLANTVIWMEVSAESAPYGTPISIESLIDEGGQFLGLSFQIPKNSEFVFPPIVASMYSYNGTVLPALPEWDKETYPYAVMIKYVPLTSSTDGIKAYVIASSEPLSFDGSGAGYYGYAEGVCSTIAYLYSDKEADEGENYYLSWAEYDGYRNENIPSGEKVVSLVGSLATTVFIWSNYDVYHTDGTMLCEASDPVPVQLVGYSYNGTVLPKLPEWDKTAYPYAFISNYIFDSVIFHALAQEPYNNGIAPNEGTICNPYDESIPLVQSFLSEDGNSWDELTTGSLGPSGQISEPFWSNFDVKYENGSVQLSASEPVPVYEPI